MIEVLKQALEALEKSLPRLAPYGEQDWLDCKAAIASLRQAIREHAMYEVQRLGQEIEQEPVAWMFEDSEDNGHKTFQSTPPSLEAVTYLAKWNRPTWMPLYTHPPQLEQNFCPRCGKRTNDIHTCTPPQRTEQLKACVYCGQLVGKENTCGLYF